MAAGDTHRRRGPGARGGARGEDGGFSVAGNQPGALLPAFSRGSHLPLTGRVLPWSLPLSSWSIKVSRRSARCVPERPASPCGQRRAMGSGESGDSLPGGRVQHLDSGSGAPLAQRAEFAGAQPRAGGVGAALGRGEAGPGPEGTLGSTRDPLPRTKMSLPSSHGGPRPASPAWTRSA